MKLNLIPYPKEISYNSGTFSLMNVSVCVKSIDDTRLMTAALKLQNDIEAVTGNFTKVGTSLETCDNTIVISVDIFTASDYTLSIKENGIEIKGTTYANAFYGIQTLRQIIKNCGTELPSLEISDTPDFKDRGYYFDVSRGRVPTVDKVCKIIDFLAYYKVNELQLYIEDAFLFEEYKNILNRDNALTPEEILEIDDYCYENFIDFVPSLSTFGHLYTLLESDDYKHLCELDDYPQQIYWINKMMHHTIDVSNPQSIEVIKSTIDQYLPLFRSKKFNICCDETFDLCKGKNSGKDARQEYIKFLLKIIEHVKGYGKTVEMWGDIVLSDPSIISKLPKDVILLNWGYEPSGDREKVKILSDNNMRQVLCPGLWGWYEFVEDIEKSVPNVSNMAKFGKEFNAEGFLTTCWGDYGHICNFGTILYGTVLGASKAWNVSIPADESFESTVSELVYGSDKNFIKVIYDVVKCERTCSFENLVRWYSANYIEKDTENYALEYKYQQEWQKFIYSDENEAKANLNKLSEIIDSLDSYLKNCPDIYSDFKLSTEAVMLITRTYLAITTKEKDASLISDWNIWFDDYKARWLEEDKYSYIDNIKAFIDDVMKVI